MGGQGNARLSGSGGAGSTMALLRVPVRLLRAGEPVTGMARSACSGARQQGLRLPMSACCMHMPEASPPNTITDLNWQYRKSLSPGALLGPACVAALAPRPNQHHQQTRTPPVTSRLPSPPPPPRLSRITLTFTLAPLMRHCHPGPIPASGV